MNAWARAACALALYCAVSSCAGEARDPTQVMVVVDAQPGVRARAAKMRIVVRGTTHENTVAYDRTLSASAAEIILPYVLALTPKNGDASRRFEVLVTVTDAEGAFVAQARAVSGYVKHQKLVLFLLLEDSCANISCGELETCAAGRCGSAAVDPAGLDPLNDVDLPDGGTAIGTGVPGGGTSGAGGTSGSGGASGAGGADPDAECTDGVELACGTEVGVCAPGVRRCVDGSWTTCSDAVWGSAETCDLEDDDCDGDIDENATCTTDGLANTSSAVCEAGACVARQCQSLWGDCNDARADGCEQALTTLEHCGVCDAPCAIANATETCTGGTCQVAVCDAGYGDCNLDGTSCETPLDTIFDCGACGASCDLANASATCAEFSESVRCEITACASSRYEDCDSSHPNGCEVDLLTDPNDCGACGYDCENRANANGASCEAGACHFDCTGDYLDCDGLSDNGCEYDSASSGMCPRCFESGTSNFSADAYGYAAAVDFACGGTHTFDSTAQTWDTDCCGACPEVSGPVAQTSASGPQVVILRAQSFAVASGTTLRLVGQYPVIIAVQGDAAIAGAIDASADGGTPGAGGNRDCGSSAGTDGTGSNSAGASGGGGGGFGTTGGDGGSGQYGTPGTGGAARGVATIEPLLGGCGGGRGGACPETATGAGGGAFQLSVAGRLSVSGVLSSRGGDAADGCGQEGGGAGGGSGGAILLEASMLEVASASLSAAGGNGGAGANGPAGGRGATSSASSGTDGSDDDWDGGSGGGGGYGRVLVRDCLGP